MLGRNDRLPHNLVPLELALMSIRRAVYPVVQPPPLESIANVVASVIPLYEYSPDGQRVLRTLRRADLRGGLFRRNGRELHFLDGRAPKIALAVHVDDAQCIIEMLKNPDSAMRIRSKFLKAWSRDLQEWSADLTRRTDALRGRGKVRPRAVAAGRPSSSRA